MNPAGYSTSNITIPELHRDCGEDSWELSQTGDTEVLSARHYSVSTRGVFHLHFLAAKRNGSDWQRKQEGLTTIKMINYITLILCAHVVFNNGYKCLRVPLCNEYDNRQ